MYSIGVPRCRLVLMNAMSTAHTCQASERPRDGREKVKERQWKIKERQWKVKERQ